MPHTQDITKIDPQYTSKDELLAGLNPEQQAAVTHDTGPLLIVAGAGTGKTTVLTRRIAWLITNGLAKPDEILALTFTEKAAGEMVERVDMLLPMGYVDLWVSTFHSFCQRMLEAHALDIGLPEDARLLNQTDAYLLVRKHFERFDLDYYRPLGNPNKFIHSLLAHFSRAKDEAVTPKEYLDFAKETALDKDDAAQDADDASRLQEIANAYHTYQQLMLDEGCMDFGDLLINTITLFRTRPSILRRYRQQFKYVIVDEFQDTNWAQYELLKMLVAKDGNIVVVGDDDQAIYKFRGASVANILQFKDDYPETKEIVLTKNYRSKQNILDASYEFIKQNDPNRLEARLADTRKPGEPMIVKRLSAEREGEAMIEHLHYASLDDEVAGVIDRIVTIRDRRPECAWSDFAILVRSNSSADVFSNELQRRGIPYQFLALKGLYGKPIVLDILSYFRLLDDYHESGALYRVLTTPAYHVTGMDLITLNHEARRKTESLFETLLRHNTLKTLAPETHATIERLLADVERHTQLARHRNVSEVLVKFLYDSGYAETLKHDNTIEARERISHLKQLLDRIRRFEAGHDEPTLRHFMEEFEMERDSGDDGGLKFDIDTGPDMVRVTTIHAAKGLEFPYVFVVNMVDKRFPAINRSRGIELPDALTKERLPEGDIHLEEERRLCYVAMTRAKDGLFFSSAEDYGGRTKKKISRFLAELGFDAPTVTPRPEGTITEAPKPVRTKRPDYVLPKYFSFTQLAAYDSCPLQYKYAHVIRIPVLGNYRMSFGKTMHAALERFVNRIATRTDTTQGRLFPSDAASQEDGALPMTREELMTIYDEVWHDEWYPDKDVKEEYREEGRIALNRIYDEMTERRPDTLFLEKDFKLKIGGDRWIRGKIDRIDRLNGNEVEIIDYKTGTPKDAKSLRREDKRQLYLYHLAVERLFELKPTKLTFKYLKDGSEVSFEAKEKDLERLEEEAREGIDKIKTADFTPSAGRHCRFCDFKEICEFRES